jgi:hypothetical protein
MSAKVIPFRGRTLKLNSREDIPQFVQPPLAGLYEMFEEANEPEAPTTPRAFNFERDDNICGPF